MKADASNFVLLFLTVIFLPRKAKKWKPIKGIVLLVTQASSKGFSLGNVIFFFFCLTLFHSCDSSGYWQRTELGAVTLTHAGTCSLTGSFLMLNQTYSLCSPCGHAHLPLLRLKRLVLPCNKASSLLFRLLLRIPHYSFNIVVMDKHGMDKERYPFPATPAELFALIDKFPLRKDEMKLQAEIGQSCP